MGVVELLIKSCSCFGRRVDNISNRFKFVYRLNIPRSYTFYTHFLETFKIKITRYYVFFHTNHTI